MAHTSSGKVVAEMAKKASNAGGATTMGGMMGPMMGGMMQDGAMGPMMGGMMRDGAMGPMMGGMMRDGAMGPMMSGMMRDGMMGPMMGAMPEASAAGAGMMMRGMATGAAVSATGKTGKSLAKRIFGHPVVLIGLGIAVGYLVHKYRKEIIASISGSAPTGEQ